MAIRISLEPLISINATYLGDAPVYDYGKNGEAKTLNPDSIYLKFACPMLLNSGFSQEVLSLEKVKSSLQNSDNQSSLQCKILKEEFNKINKTLIIGNDGTLTFTPKAVQGNFYPAFFKWTTREITTHTNNVQQQQTATSK